MSDVEGARVSRISAGPIAITRFAPLTMTPREVVDLFEQSVPRWAARNDLAGKAYLLGRDGASGGAVYLFRPEAAPESIFNDAWREQVLDRYGVHPKVDVFDSPIQLGLMADYPPRS